MPSFQRIALKSQPASLIANLHNMAKFSNGTEMLKCLNWGLTSYFNIVARLSSASQSYLRN